MPRPRKNPFMSLWLSAANRITHAGGGAMSAAVRRQQSAMAAEAAKAVTAFWRRALPGSSCGRPD